MATLPAPISTRNVKFYKQRLSTRPEDYRPLYRFDEVNVEWIANHFLGQTTEKRGKALTSKTKMQIFLRYLSDPGFQSGVAEDVGVDRTTVSKIITQVMNKIIEKASMWIKFPSTELEIQEAKNQWQNRFTMPSCIGAIDCTPIVISKSSFFGYDYINRKNRASINVQTTCNAKESFTSVEASWPGSVHDSQIWKNSNEYQFMSKTINTILIGDSGYGIAPWLIIPYPNPQSAAERNFNLVYAKERVIIERCFGQLKSSFPILHYKVRTQLKNVSKIIVCCFVLHNIAKYLSDVCFDFPDLPPSPEDDPIEIMENLSDARIRNLGQVKRSQITEVLYHSRN